MSDIVETLNHGEVDNFGFIFRTDIVHLGELPPLSLAQFSQFSADTIIQLLPRLDEENLRHARWCIRGIKRRHKEIRIRDMNNDEELPQFRDTNIQKVGEIAKDGSTIELYGGRLGITQEELSSPNPKERARAVEHFLISMHRASGFPPSAARVENPFILDGTNIKIGDKYTLNPRAFIAFSAKIFMGGIGGWDENLGVPDFVARHGQRIVNACPDIDNR